MVNPPAKNRWSMAHDGMYTVSQSTDFIEYFLGARLPVQKYAFIVSKLIAT